MPLPWIILGAAVAGAVAVRDANSRIRRQDQERFKLPDPDPHEPDTAAERAAMARRPSDFVRTDIKVKPVPGAILCCGIYGLFEHTGIWLPEGLIVELHGSGLVRAATPKRFLQNRTGSRIFVACDSTAHPLADEQFAERARAAIFSVETYDPLANNCHRFSWRSISEQDEKLTTFKDFNVRLANWFKRRIYWDLCDLDERPWRQTS